MKYALISLNEYIFDFSNPPIQIGVRIADVAYQPFEVAFPLFWVNCPDDIEADKFYWNGNECVATPSPPSKQLDQMASTTGAGGPNVIA